MDEASSRATGGKDHSTLNPQVLLGSRETQGSLREQVVTLSPFPLVWFSQLALKPQHIHTRSHFASYLRHLLLTFIPCSLEIYSKCPCLPSNKNANRDKKHSIWPHQSFSPGKSAPLLVLLVYWLPTLANETLHGQYFQGQFLRLLLPLLN